MVPNRDPNLGRARNPKLGATSERDGVVVENRRHDERPIEDPGDQYGVPELRELVAEAAVGREAEELFRRRYRAAEGDRS